jgi:uncharacterized membrane protein (UPF0182 family)
VRNVVLVAFAVAFVTFFVVPWLGGFATDLLWFREVHFEPVFFTSLIWRTGLFAGAAAIAFGLVYGNVRMATANLSGFPALFVDRGGGVRVDISRFVPRLFLAGSLFIAFITGLSASVLWMTILMAVHGATVGAVDSLFGRDIGFYLFTLPAISEILNTLLLLLVASLVGVAIIYGLRGELVLPPRKTSAGPGAARHLGILLALLFVLLGVRLWIIGASELLYSGTGPLLGASYTDVHVRLPAIRLSAIVAMLAAAAVIYGVIRRQLIWYAFVSTLLYIGVGIVFRGIAPTMVQKFGVAPNELTRERPYIAQHIAATRRAWNIDSVQTRALEGDVQLTMADIKANAPTIDNVRLWERDLLKQTFGQLQEIRTYYDFFSVNDDRYMIDGRYRQVHLSARELNTASLPTRNFINDRLTFTHGMGVTMAPVNQVTSEGLPVLFIKDVPPVSTVSIKVTRPQIYYGEMTNSYVFVGTGQKEFDYPAGETNTYTNYTGPGGVPVGSTLRRALYAWQFDSPDIVLSSYITPGARILYHRNITDRAKTALPFLDFDSDPYLIVTDAGELKWILDAYTSSENYPYSQRVQDGTNYMRNSVKVVIDAYDGTVDAYLADPNDPVVQTYAAIFPGIFKPLATLAADVRRHLRYPADLFRMQTDLHATYHMVEPDAFYHREDQWQYPTVAAGSPSGNTFMRHIILRLPGEKAPEYIFMTPFTPRGKDNLAAWMVARMDGDHYGQLVVYKFPKQSLVYGPKQIANRINQDTDISRQLTLWDQKGSQVIRGELLVIPIEESLIYVQPIYLRAEGGTIPELKRVVVAHENRVAMGETLEEGLNLLFGNGTATRAPIAAAADGAPLPSADASAISQAQQHYDRAIAAQRAGDWTTYGREIEQLGASLKQLRARKP